jgi:outer membrane protein TolC
MDRASPHRSPRARRLPWRLAQLLAAGGPLVALGCAQPMSRLLEYGPPGPPPTATARVDPAPAVPQPAPEVVPVGHTAPAPPPGAAKPKEVPITFDTVLRLAEAHNARISLARERLNESLLSSQNSVANWLPNTYAGIAYYRHEGGIQNEDGTLTHSSFGALFPGVQIQTELDVKEATFRQVDAERKVWQSKAELTQVDNEVLLDAANTYIDLLTARRGEAVARELENYERKLLKRAEELARDERGARVLVEGLQGVLSNRQQRIAKLRQQGNAASAKLAYLLGLPPDVCLVPVDAALVPIDLVDASQPCEVLVAKALEHGPGVRELEGLLATIQGGLAQASGPQRLLPTVQLNVFEGAFGAGPGSSLNWDNRLDIGVQARWNLTQLATAQQQKRLAHSRIQQVHLNLEDVRGKLTLGVREAQGAILSNREQIGLASGQIRHASESYRLSDLRLREGVAGATTGDVLQNIQGLEQAHFNYIQAINGYNKAEVRLLLLLGSPNVPGAGHGRP